ncbi:MAG: CheR family methyltransferase, partial [Polyangiales bacterium]
MSTAASQQVAAVLAMIAERSGLVFPDHRRTTAGATIAEFLAERDLRGVHDLATSGHLPALLERLVVHESFFDRDLDQMTFVDDVVLPELGQSSDVPLRVWSAGCAGGEEAYTLAFMLAKRGLFDRAAVLGTDLSEAALDRARRGRYRAWS